MIEDARTFVDTVLDNCTNAILMGCLAGTVCAMGKSFAGQFTPYLTIENGRIVCHRLGMRMHVVLPQSVQT